MQSKILGLCHPACSEWEAQSGTAVVPSSKFEQGDRRAGPAGLVEAEQRITTHYRGGRYRPLSAQLAREVAPAVHLVLIKAFGSTEHR